MLINYWERPYRQATKVVLPVPPLGTWVDESDDKTLSPVRVNFVDTNAGTALMLSPCSCVQALLTNGDQ
jgi:hypothetical protein